MRPHTFAAFFAWYLWRNKLTSDSLITVRLSSPANYYDLELMAFYETEIRMRAGGSWGCDMRFVIESSSSTEDRIWVYHQHKGASSDKSEYIRNYQGDITVTTPGHSQYTNEFRFDLRPYASSFLTQGFAGLYGSGNGKALTVSKVFFTARSA